MLASLGMYDMPALRPATDRFWTLIRDKAGFGPEALTRERDLWEIWLAPDLVLAQTCGLPYRTRLHGRVALVGTPDFGLPGCPPGHYNSVLIGRAGGTDRLEDAAAGVFAFNDGLSQSGWAGPMHHLAELGLAPARVLETGSHAASLRAVAEGRADLAGIDAFSFALLAEAGLAEGVREIARTEPVPGLPYITATGHDAGAMAAAVSSAIGALAAEDRRALHLRGLVSIPADAYLALPTPAGPA